MEYDHIISELTRFWKELLGVESVGTDENYFDLGGDSILAVHLFAEISHVFDVKLPVATLYESPTIETLARKILEGTPKSQWSSLVPIQPNGSRPPLFFMHGAGGNVLIYRGLALRLGVEQPVYGLQSQGLDGESPLLSSVEDMAAAYIREIRSIQQHGPYFLGGYCGGGTIAYEVAQQLVSNGERVDLLALMDTCNWSVIPKSGWLGKTYHASEEIAFHIANLASLDFGGGSRFIRDKFYLLKSRAPVWRGKVMQRFSGRQQTKASVPLLLARIWQENDEACGRYKPKPYPGKITDIRPKRQYRSLSYTDSKWEKLARCGQETIVLPVFPAGMLVEPLVKHLASALREAMDRAMARTAVDLQCT